MSNVDYAVPGQVPKAAVQQDAGESPAERAARIRRRLTRIGTPLLFIAPAVGFVGVFKIWPFIQSIRLSFTNWSGIGASQGVGFANYRALWHDQIFRRGIVMNLKILLTVPLWVTLAFLMAAALQSRVIGWKVWRSALFFPVLISPVIVAIAFQAFLSQNGALNSILRSVHLSSWSHLWLDDPSWSLFWVVVVFGWSTIGVGTVILLAAMGTVDTNLLDAARIDGAGWLTVQRRVVFWQLLPIMELFTVVMIITSFVGVFPVVLLMTSGPGGPAYSTTTADYYSYQQAFTYFHFGYGSTIAVVLFIGATLMTGIMMALFGRKRSTR